MKRDLENVYNVYSVKLLNSVHSAIELQTGYLQSKFSARR